MVKKEELKNCMVDPEKLLDCMTEDSIDTFLPNEVFYDPKKVGLAKKIVVSKNGEVDVYMDGWKYPYQGYPWRSMVKTACIIKKTTLILIEFFASLANRREILKLIILRKNIQDLLPKLLVLFAHVIGSRRLKEKYYNHTAKEIYRVFNIMIDREEPGGMRDKWSRIRDIVCLIIQFDPAYGYRLQDFLSEIDMKKIKLTRRDLFFARQSNDYRFGGKKILKR